ncbi:hypothetical protein [Sulfitobacter sp. R18_1]|uniref:hypothetical protein n=1 Tax=Sulfitobacter sp. R18_1 TaxID=2821104 RepID=UPI001AD9E6FF|nr:hypothetical protein [Sulfitobacter sp. R18_1]MBO9430609.1 hypothetical protein [Sulfitobacter sp. R18_1]
MNTTGYRPAEEFARQATCTICNGRERVCENHPDKAWPKECDCGAGMPCVCSPLHKHQPKQDSAPMDQKQFIKDAAHAQPVTTKLGPALLIGGHVIQVSGPEGTDWVDLLAKALRPRYTVTDADLVARGLHVTPIGIEPLSPEECYDKVMGTKHFDPDESNSIAMGLEEAKRRAALNTDPAHIEPYKPTDRTMGILKRYARLWSGDKA